MSRIGKRVLLFAGMLAFPASCNTSQPGCTAENIRVMADACRVSFDGVSPYCLATNHVEAGMDYTPWALPVCNAHAGNGALAECIAGKADACRGARDAGTTPEQVISPCLDSSAKGPEKSCDDACTATRTTCDDKCTGGKACNSCVRMGGPCADVCPDAGFKTCADCSLQCALQYIACSDHCPQQ
jgi:hypothetical protein